MAMKKLEQHPLIQYLEPTGDTADRQVNVLRVERRDLKGSSIWAGPYLAFVVEAGDAETEVFPCVDHADVEWAVGFLVYSWFMRFGIPPDGTHATRALFSVEDIELEQELKCWFRIDMTNGHSRACPIVAGLDATSPGDYSSVNDYLMTLPQYRKPERLTLRVSAVLIPEARCPDSTRELTLRADAGQELRYRVDASGKHEVTGRSDQPSTGPTLEEIIDLAKRKKTPPP
jgi:hypothetical protein